MHRPSDSRICVWFARVTVMLVALLSAPVTSAYGPQGHLIAGRVAAGFLCREAAAEVGRLGADDGLDELGLWADRIRSTDAYAHTAPWHYMNIADGALVTAYRSPPEGDVLTAIERHYNLLSSDGGSETARGEALRFLTHFVVDLHQPLHVGRADDRGGNTIDVVLGRERINLHRFWDTEAITTAGLGTVEYARSMTEDVETAIDGATYDPRGWAEDSLAYRERVYAFDRRAPLSADYIEAAQAITRERLILASARLAATLNSLFCD
jgi:hypothetical protein